jgi:hypothetical protein
MESQMLQASREPERASIVAEALPAEPALIAASQLSMKRASKFAVMHPDPQPPW